MKAYIQELTKIKMAAGFYEEWSAEKLHGLKIIAKFGFPNSDEKPEWHQAWSDGQTPRLVKKDDQTMYVRKTIYRSWDDFFCKQRKIVNAFLKSGDITPFCRELEWFVREIVADKRTTYVFKKWLFLMIDVVRSAHLAKSPFALLSEIEHQTLSFELSLHYFWGWHHEVAPMLPDYSLGKKRREDQRRFSKHQRDRGSNEDIEIRNERIRKAAYDIQEKCKKREKSLLQIALELSRPPYDFYSCNEKPLSVRQLRKIISQ